MSRVDRHDELDEWRENTDVRASRALTNTQTEADLLLAIDHLDHETRGVYADWLEEHGELERAEFVRLQDQLVGATGFERRVIADRCREIAASQDLAWRALIARPPILNCWREAGCPGDWGSLAPTGLAEVRYCTTCETCVHYCASEQQSDRYNERVEPFVFDIVHELRTTPLYVAVPPLPEDPDGGTTFDDTVPPWRR